MSLGTDFSPEQMNNRQIQIDSGQLKKMDILFYDSINKLKSSYTNSFIYHFIKALIFIIFIPIDYSIINQPNDNRILAAMIIAIVVSILQTFSELLFRCSSLRNNQLILNICRSLNHHSQEPITNIDRIQDCVSATLYNKQNQTLINNEGLTEDIKKMYVNVLSSNIKEILKRDQQCFSRIDSLAGLVGFASLIFAIVALAVSQKNTPELVLLIIYIVLEGFSKILILAIFLLLALSPLLCCLLICCACFCSGSGEERVKLPQTERATEKMITDADGTCSICFQNFIVNDNVIRLTCSPKHMFHPICIESWIKLKPTCPYCRAPIGEQLNRSAPI